MVIATASFEGDWYDGAKTELAHGQVLVKVYDMDGLYYEVRDERRFNLDQEHDPFQMQPWALYEALPGCLDDPVDPEFDGCPTCGEDGGTSCGLPSCGLLPPTTWPFPTSCHFNERRT